MKSVKKSFRKTELTLLVVGLLVHIVGWITTVLSEPRNDVYISLTDSGLKYLTLGYFFCFLAFTISYELFFLLEPNPKTRKWGYLLLTNFKLVIIGGLFYYVRLTGIPATGLVIGFIVCETLAVFVLLINAYRSKNLFKASKIKTDSGD